MRAGFVAICLTFILSAPDAQSNTLIGSGTASCGEWISEQNELVRSARRLWVLGYLSGLNALSSVDFLKGFEVEGISAAIDKYCRENPLKDVAEATLNVAAQMRRMKK